MLAGWLVLVTHDQSGMVSSFDEAWKCPESQEHEDTICDPEESSSMAAVEPDGSYYDKGGHDKIRVHLPNGRTLP